MSNDPWAIVMEYYPCGSLKSMLEDPKIEITMEKSVSVAKDIAKGMIFLHSEGVNSIQTDSKLTTKIIHRDLAARNVLIAADEDGKWTAKICDLGSTFSLFFEFTALF